MKPKHTPVDLFHASSAGSWVALALLVFLLSVPDLTAILQNVISAVGNSLVTMALSCFTFLGAALLVLVFILTVVAMTVGRRGR